jgi:hypothetical protein
MRIQSASESRPLTVIKTILPSFGGRREDVDQKNQLTLQYVKCELQVSNIIVQIKNLNPAINKIVNKLILCGILYTQSNSFKKICKNDQLIFQALTVDD